MDAPAFTWLFSWHLDQEHPTVEINQQDDTVSYAAFPENPNSFAIIEGHLFDKYNFRAPPSASDAERIIEYYNIFGEDLFIKLRGGYSVVIWDAAERKLVAGRDHMGKIPFYYFGDGKRILISSSMVSLLEKPGVPDDYNRVMIAEHLMNRYPAQQLTETFFQNISRLPPAHYFKLINEYFQSTRYWDPLPIGFTWATKEETNLFPEMFEQAVKRTLSVGADSISLSGGLDSISIAVMAGKIIENNSDFSLHAISGKYHGSGADDGKIQRSVANELNIPQTLLAIDEILPFQQVIQSSLDRSDLSPLPSQNITESAFSGLMKIASKNNLSKVLLGFGGDEMFFVYRGWLFDLFSTGRFNKIIDYYQVMGFYLTDAEANEAKRRGLKYGIGFAAKSILKKIRDGVLLAKHLNNTQPLPDWLLKSDNQFIQRINHRRQITPSPYSSRENGYYISSLQQILQDPVNMHLLEHRYFNARAEGFVNFYPFFDPDMIRLTYRMRPEEKIKNNFVKAPLQQFINNNISGLTLPAKKSNIGPTIDNLLRQQGKQAWQTTESGQCLEEIQITNLPIINLQLDKYFQSQTENWDLTWKVISTEVWLRNFRQ